MTLLLFNRISDPCVKCKDEVYSCMSDEQASEQASEEGKEPDGNASYVSRT